MRRKTRPLYLHADVGGPDDPIDVPVDVEVDGTWSLSGRGSRSDCQDEVYEGEFVLGSNRQLVIAQAVDPLGPDTLTLAQPISPAQGTFTLTGEVELSQVTFSTLEDTGTDRFSFRFFGGTTGSRISGTFEGSGPQTCTSAGTFEVFVTR